MSNSGYTWDLKASVAQGTAAFEELGSLENLLEIYGQKSSQNLYASAFPQ